MCKPRELIKKIGDIQGTFHARMDREKDRKMEMTQQKQKTVRRSDKNTQNNWEIKVLMTWITMLVWSLT